MLSRGHIVLLLSIFALCQAQQESTDSQRQGKIFYVTTTSSTSTFSTASLCYVKKATDTVLITCKKRKRRTVEMGQIEGEDELAPSVVSSLVPGDDEEKSNDLADVEGGLRNGKFVNYWITTTVTSTTTAFSTTQTIASILCTPYGFTYNQCG